MTRQRRIAWSFYPYFAALIVAVSVFSGALAVRSINHYHVRRSIADLTARAELCALNLPPAWRDWSAEALQTHCLRLSQSANVRITLVGGGGRVLADSEIGAARTHSTEADDVETQSFRPEVQTALNGLLGIDIRELRSTDKRVVYVAVPVRSDGSVVAALRVSAPLASIAPELGVIQWRLLAGLVIAAAIAAVVTVVLSRKIRRAIAAIQSRADSYASGDFSEKLILHDSTELSGLAEALNRMADQLGEKIRTITKQRNEQEAILSSLREIVIAVNHEERVLFVNRAAADILKVDPQRVVGRLVQEVARNSHLQRFITDRLSGQPQSQELEATLLLSEDVVLQVAGYPLQGGSAATSGVLIVMNDISRLRKLENMRREFVANVSHELKTPITAIKGFVETLEEGALEDKSTAQDMLRRIGHNADRLNAIIDDLLSLSRIEQEGEHGVIQLATGNVGSVVSAAISQCSLKANDKAIRLELAGDNDVTARLNAILLEQAICNLLDNAIKYSPEGSEVRVSVIKDAGEARIRVQDHGIGIPADHLPRIFERFYRVDKARSRKLGGTGLGLAIVKHISVAHGGRVSVVSTVGSGSEFTIHLPLIR